MAAETGWKYPSVRRDDNAVEEYTDEKIKVQDPYRWLEDPDSEETASFVKAQNKISQPYLESIPERQAFHSRMEELFNYEKYTAPFKRGERYFYFYNSGLQNQNVLYVQDSLEEKGKVFFDPNLLSEDGTVALGSYAFSEDGEWFAYELSESGSDWKTIHIMNVSSKEKLPEELKLVKFSRIAWTHDHKGFFYQRFPDPASKSDGTETQQVKDQKTYYHRLGSPQNEDVLCYEFPEEPEWLMSTEVSDCGRYVILYIHRGAEPKNLLFFSDLNNEQNKSISGKLAWVAVVKDFEASFDFISNEGTVFTILTDCAAPKYRLINIDISSPGKESWKTLIPEHDKDVLEWTACVNETKLVVCYLQDVKHVLHLYDMNGQFLKNFPLEVGTVAGYHGRKKDSEIFYKFVSFLTPGAIYHVNLKEETLEPKVFREIIVFGFDSSAYETKQIFYSSKDGTEVPMFIVHKKGLVQDGSHPTLMYGYGGFNISLSPYFSVSRVIFMQHFGGVFALPNIRGGGEYGEKWHESGTMGKKQNVLDDFQAAGEYLIKEKYTSPNKLCIMGGSNGGLLVCACANQRPDLFKCVISQVGVLDMLRFNKFTIGHAWVTDFGNPDVTPDFHWLYKYSPLHNIPRKPQGGQYPAILLLTADHDDRVVPLHSFKFAAELQHILGDAPEQKNPLMIRIEPKAGHGGGKPTAKILDECADTYAFIARNLGVSWKA
jgi:prolyl oligopeptidase